jgi:hypothetical protein
MARARRLRAASVGASGERAVQRSTCKATRQRCRRRVIGGGPCIMHGGAAEQAKTKREQRVAIAGARAAAAVEQVPARMLGDGFTSSPLSWSVRLRRSVSLSLNLMLTTRVCRCCSPRLMGWCRDGGAVCACGGRRDPQGDGEPPLPLPGASGALVGLPAGSGEDGSAIVGGVCFGWQPGCCDCVSGAGPTLRASIPLRSFGRHLRRVSAHPRCRGHGVSVPTSKSGQTLFHVPQSSVSKDSPFLIVTDRRAGPSCSS